MAKKLVSSTTFIREAYKKSSRLPTALLEELTRIQSIESVKTMTVVKSA